MLSSAANVMDLLGGPNIVWHIGGIFLAVVLGAFVGVEREWRAKSAGLRTTVLVSIGAALFTIIGFEAVSGGGGDQTRVAAQVVSGIGFLGAGVIIKHGSSVRGLTTAATMWTAAAVGALCGAGLYLLAIVGALFIGFTNIVMRPVSKWLDAKSPNTHPAVATEYSVEVHCLGSAQDEIRGLLLAAGEKCEMQLTRMTSTELSSEFGDDEENATSESFASRVHVKLELQSEKRCDVQFDRALSAVIAHPEVSGVDWSATAA